MEQQTAVEWLINRIAEKELRTEIEWKEIFEQAKAMEKEQIIKSNRDGVDMCVDKKYFITGEQYYNETYGNQGSPDTSSLNIKNK